MKLIDDDEFVEYLKDNLDIWKHPEALDWAIGKLKQEPAADAEPVRHRRWVPQRIECVSTRFVCSGCKREVEITNDYFGKPTKHAGVIYPYCHCGAKMDGDKHEF